MNCIELYTAVLIIYRLCLQSICDSYGHKIEFKLFFNICPYNNKYYLSQKCITYSDK